MEKIKLNKNGKVDVLCIINDFEGDQDTVYPLQDHERLANDIECNWERGEKKEVVLKEFTKEEYLETIRNGMECGGHCEEEINEAVSSTVFE